MLPDADAIILCAGLGTRLKPLTDFTAKPAVPLFGRPLVGYAMALLKAAGFARVCINTHWRPDEMRSAASEQARGLGLALTTSYEPVLLGTGGVFRQLRDQGFVRPQVPLVVLNGDVLFDVDLPELLRRHASTGAAATMVLRPMPAGATYSPVEADEAGRIHRIGRFGEAGRGQARLFTGVHVLSPEALALLPQGESGIVEAVYARLLAAGARVQAALSDGLWLDLGDPRSYLEAHLALMKGDLPLGALERCGALGRPVSAVSPEARIAPSATIVNSAIGRGALVGKSARVEDSVVWPGASVAAGEALRRTIVTPHGRVTVP